METSKFVPVVAFHPGETLSEKLTEMHMSIKEFALRVSKPEKTIHAVIKGESSVTSDMAVAFESVTKIPASFWLNKQRHYDEYMARCRYEAIVEEACEWAKRFPYNKMAELEWIKPCHRIQDKARELLSFFQISSSQAWEDYYLHQKLKISFSISLAQAKDSYSLSAWLRQGEIQASEVDVTNYSEDKLKEAVNNLKSLMSEEPNDFTTMAQEVCAEAGVKLIYTTNLPKLKILGASRWIKGTPCLQINEEYKTKDFYWFLLFREIGHILLHGKKDIFLTGEKITEESWIKEQEANDYASHILSSLNDNMTTTEVRKYQFDNVQLNLVSEEENGSF